MEAIELDQGKMESWMPSLWEGSVLNMLIPNYKHILHTFIRQDKIKTKELLQNVSHRHEEKKQSFYDIYGSTEV